MLAEPPKLLLPGKLSQLKELLLSYNRIQLVPEELSCCQSLERLELAMNQNLEQLPDQVRVQQVSRSHDSDLRSAVLDVS